MSFRLFNYVFFIFFLVIKLKVIIRMMEISDNITTSKTHRKNQTIKHYDTHRANVQLSPLSFTKIDHKLHNYPSLIVAVNSDQISKFKEILEWRIKTEFPIVKVRSFQLLNEGNQRPQQSLQFMVELEGEMKSLDDLMKLHLSQAVYVLKESMIGFERLCHRFGFFSPSAQLIKFNQNKNCRVWINQDCFSNLTNSGNIRSQSQFVTQLCNVIEAHTIKSRLESNFFQRIRSCLYFFQAISSIDEYARINKIKIPNRFHNINDVKFPLMLTSKNKQTIQMKNREKQESQNHIKVPNFIIKNNLKKAVSQGSQLSVPQQKNIADYFIHDGSQSKKNLRQTTKSFFQNKLTKKKLNQTNQKYQKSIEEDLKIRIIEPEQDGNKILKPTTSSINLQLQNGGTTPPSLHDRVSDIDLSKSRNSRMSFQKCSSRGNLSNFEVSEKMLLTDHRLGEDDRKYSPTMNRKVLSTKCIKTFDFDDEHESSSALQQDHKLKRFIPLSINQIKDRRKFSGDYLNLSGGINTERTTVDKQQFMQSSLKPKNFLDIPKLIQKRQRLKKSPSHIVISKSASYNKSQEGNQQKSDQQFIRETILNKNKWNGLKLLTANLSMKQSLVDNCQIPRVGQTKTSELPKLGTMGRTVRSSMIDECEFQLQYGQKIEKEKSFRQQISSILD